MKTKGTKRMTEANALEVVLRRHPAAFVDLHPENEHLVAFQEERMDDEDAESIKHHVASCPVCKEKVSLLKKADRGEGSPSFASQVLVRLVEYLLPARAVVAATAASRTPRDAPDEEVRLDQPGAGSFEAYLQRFGDRLAIAVFASAGGGIDVLGVRDAFTGEPIGTQAGPPKNNEWLIDLGSVKTLAGRKIALVLVVGARPMRIEVNIAKARRRRRSG